MVGLIGSAVAAALIVIVFGGPWALTSGVVLGALLVLMGIPGTVVSGFVLSSRTSWPVRAAASALLCGGSVGLLMWAFYAWGSKVQGPTAFDATPLVIVMAGFGAIGGVIGEFSMRDWER